jgi:hypothetical protein
LRQAVGANAQTQQLRANARTGLRHDSCLARRRTGNDVGRKGQLLEGLHCRLHLVRPRCIKHSLLLALLLHAGRQHRVDVLQVHLLAGLTQAHELLSEARDPLAKTRRLLLRTKPSLNARESELRGLKPEVPGRLRAGQTKLAALQCARLRKLLGAQTQAATCFCRTRRRTGADLSKLASELCTLHGTIGRRLKACCAKLCRGARLLLKDVALQLLLGNCLPRATKGTGLHGLSTNLLLSELTLTADVCQRLLHCGFFKRAHEAHGCARCQTCDASAGRLEAKGRRFLELALRFGRRGTGALSCNVSAGNTAFRCRFDASGCALKGGAAGIDYAGNLTCKTPCFAQRSLKCCHAFFRQGLTTLKERAIRTDALPRKLEGALLVCHEPRNLLLGQLKVLLHQAVSEVRDTRPVLSRPPYSNLASGKSARNLTRRCGV